MKVYIAMHKAEYYSQNAQIRTQINLLAAKLHSKI